MHYDLSLTRNKAAVFKCMLYLLMIFLLSPLLFPGDYVFNENLGIYPLHFTLRIFTLDNHKNIIGRTFNKGTILYKVVNNGNSLKPIRTFPEPIVGIHVMANNHILVSTDKDHWNPHTPCKIYLSKNNGQSFSLIKTLAESGSIWWSMASDRLNNIYIGEYGPKGIDQSKRVWKSSDLGKSWKVIFNAPNLEGVHIHLVAVDPFTQHLWVSYGDERDGVLVSNDYGETWKFISRSQPTSIVFTRDKIYFGEDKLYNGAISVYDKSGGIYQNDIFRCGNFGDYAGPVYDMTIGVNNILYVPFMKYPFLKHNPSLWIGNGEEWNLIMECPGAKERFEGFENIAGPDKYGYVYTYKYKIKDFSSLPLKNPLPRLPKNNSFVSPINVKIVWNKVKGVDKYCLVLAEDSGFKKLFLKADVKETSFTTSLPNNKKFYWKVKSLKRHMLTTSWSPVYWFKTSEAITVR